MQQAMSSYMMLGGNEIVNGARLKAYVDNGLAPYGFDIMCSGCEGLEDILPCVDSEPPPGGYQLPELPTLEEDPTGAYQAPWYDPSVPESKNFAGLLVTSVTVSSPYSREVLNSVGNGGTLGRLKLTPRTIVVHGFLIGKTCCATQYGLEWLTSALGGAPCGSGCEGEDLTFLSCCPNIGGEDACITRVNPLTGQRETYVRPNEESEYERAEDFWRTMHDVGLVSGPEIISCRGTSCGCGCGALIEVEFTLVAANPYANSIEKPILDVRPSEIGCGADDTAVIDPFPDPCAPDGVEFLLVPDDGVCDAEGDVEWHPVADGESCGESSDSCFTWIPVADDEKCPITEECADPPGCLDDPYCPTPPAPPLPVIPPAEDCGCIPIQSTRVCSTAVPGRVWGSSTLNFDVYAGEKDLRNVAIRVWQNPLGKDCCTSGCEDAPKQPVEHTLACGSFRDGSGTTSAVGPWCDGDDATLSALVEDQWAGYVLGPLDSSAADILGVRVVAHISTLPDPDAPDAPESVQVRVGVGPNNGTAEPSAGFSHDLTVPNDGLVRQYTFVLPLASSDEAAIRAGGLRTKVYVPIQEFGNATKVQVHELRVIVRAMPEHCVPEFPDCAACATLVVSYVPARGTLHFSGESRTVTVTCGTQTVNALRSISSAGNGPFSWPDLECVPVCVAVDLDCATVSEDASIVISQVYRDL